MERETTNTRPTDSGSWAFSLASRAGERVGVVLGDVAEGAAQAGRFAGSSLRGAWFGLWEWARGLREPRRLARLVGVLAILCLVVMVGLVYAHRLTRLPPSWWRTHLVIDESAGEAIETGLMGHLSAVRSADPALKPGEAWRSESWSVSLKEEDANAWLNARLPLWLANRNPPVRWPAEIASLQVRFEEGVIRMGAAVVDSGERVVAGVTIRPVVRENGSLWLESSGLDLGSLPAPAWAVGLVRGVYGDSIPTAVRDLPEVDALFGALSGQNAIFKDAVVRLDGGRRVRVLQVVSRHGRLDITFRTEKAQTRRPSGR